MRETKFRYSCKRDSGFYFSQIFTLEQIESGDAKKWIEANLVGIFHLKRDEWTGLHDNNGKEIYERDLLDVDDGDRYCRVVWFEPQGCFDTEGVEIFRNRHSFVALRNNMWAYRCVVVGNIYENPELIK